MDYKLRSEHDQLDVLSGNQKDKQWTGDATDMQRWNIIVATAVHNAFSDLRGGRRLNSTFHIGVEGMEMCWA